MIFDVHVTVHRGNFFIIKPTRCTNSSNLFLEWNSTCFEQFLCPSSGVFYFTRSKPVWHTPLPCVQWNTPDDGQKNCPKHVEFHSNNKFEGLVHLVGFIIRNLSRCTVTWTSYSLKAYLKRKQMFLFSFILGHVISKTDRSL